MGSLYLWFYWIWGQTGPNQIMWLVLGQMFKLGWESWNVFIVFLARTAFTDKHLKQISVLFFVCFFFLVIFLHAILCDRLNWLFYLPVDTLCKWAENWQMNFNVSKCKLMHIGPRDVCLRTSLGLEDPWGQMPWPWPRPSSPWPWPWPWQSSPLALALEIKHYHFFFCFKLLSSLFGEWSYECLDNYGTLKHLIHTERTYFSIQQF